VGASNTQNLVSALSGFGKKIGFEKVITMIDDMVENLKKEQIEDGNKKEYCETQFDQTEGKIKELDQSVTDSDAAIKRWRASSRP
jgi:hypothetical protein